MNNYIKIEFSRPDFGKPAFVFDDIVALRYPDCDRSEWLWGEVVGLQILDNRWLYLVQLPNGLAEECFEEDLEALPY